MKITIADLTKQLKIYAFAVQNWTKKELAERAKIAEICLRHIHEDDWNPTFETMRKLEKVIPDDWGFDSIGRIPYLEESGTIYIINCTQNGRVYVGDTKDYEGRKKLHLGNLQRNCHPCKELQADFNLYGEEFFTFTPLFNVEKREDAERKIIALLSIFTTVYNINKRN